MTRSTVPASQITRSAKPWKPYLWRGRQFLAEANKSITAEWPDGIRPTRGAEPTFSWPQPLPGPPAKSGSGSDAARARRRQEAKDERNDRG